MNDSFKFVVLQEKAISIYYYFYCPMTNWLKKHSSQWNNLLALKVSGYVKGNDNLYLTYRRTYRTFIFHYFFQEKQLVTSVIVE